MAEAVRGDPLTPHPGRLSPSHPHYRQIIEAHDAAVAAGEAGYLDPGSGLFAFTAQHHLDRGDCCDSGCRHCPYIGAGAAT